MTGADEPCVKDCTAMSEHVPAPAAPAPPGLPACAQVDLDAIASNVRALKARAGAAEVMAVVKADAYGHGLVPSAQAAVAGGATWLGVAQLPEALELRAAGVQVPLLSWLHVPGQDFGPALAADVDLGISSQWALDQVLAAARLTGCTARVHVKVDTGLGRNGAWDTDLEALLANLGAAQADRAVEVVGLFSHFAYADAPQHPTVRAQQERFEGIVGQFEPRSVTSPTPPPRSRTRRPTTTWSDPVSPSTDCRPCPTWARRRTTACARRCGWSPSSRW